MGVGLSVTSRAIFDGLLGQFQQKYEAVLRLEPREGKGPVPSGDPAKSGNTLRELLARKSRVFGWPLREGEPCGPSEILQLCHALLSNRGEATGMALSEEILAAWSGLDDRGRLKVMRGLLADFGPDVSALERAIADYGASATAENLRRLHEASEPRRQELIRRLNLARNGIVTLVDMRRQLQDFMKEDAGLAVLDADFLHLFSSWFNRGFLMLRRIDWSTPASILEKIIRYEAVHEIRDWEDLRRRLEPEDRRCFAFFHPQLPEEPLIFVEIALTREISADIAALLADRSAFVPAAEATAAVFYSISNCQPGLKGVSFGNFLIKQVVEELRRDLPNLKTFVTLSPVPGLAGWLSRNGYLADKAGEGEAGIEPETLLTGAFRYFFAGRTANGRHVDPVARFHLGNGARLERILLEADRSQKGVRQSFAVMVNYLYKPDEIEANHEAYVERGEVAASRDLQRHWRAIRQQAGKARPGAGGNRTDSNAGSRG